MDIAFIGKAGAGKDAAASRLREAHGFTRVAFADPLREMALRIDPWINWAGGGTQLDRLSWVVNTMGWEAAKRVPEVRRLLQELGQTVRAYDEYFWVNLALAKVRAARTAGTPVVITDCRYRNEAVTLASQGFRLIRIIRPDAPTALSGSAAVHSSETALDGWPCDASIVNGGSLAELALRVDALLG